MEIYNTADERSPGEKIIDTGMLIIVYGGLLAIFFLAVLILQWLI